MLLVGLALHVYAQVPAKYRLEMPVAVEAGEETAVFVIFDIEPPWYIYAPTGTAVAVGMLETSVSFEPTETIQTAEVQYPKPVEKGPFHIYEGEGIALIQRLRVRPLTEPGEYTIKGKVQYQVCKPDVCLPPVRDDIRVRLNVK